MSTNWASGRCTTPRRVVRVVLGCVETTVTFSPTMVFTSVDLPTLGRPVIVTNPERKAVTPEEPFLVRS